MSKAEKLFKQMQNNPQDWRIEEIDTVARHFGFGRIEGKGSHTKFYHDKLPEILSVPVKRPIKPIYVKQLLALIEKLEDMK
jgi:predicted RNA binding protein YcfA (HicA-like mRNA interferase family)